MRRGELNQQGSALLCWVIALIAVVAPVLLTPPSPAAAEEVGGTDVTVSIDSLTPSVATPDDTVTVTGTATNTTSEPLTRLQALLWRNQAPYTDHEQFASVLASAPTEPVGARVTEHPSAFVDLTRSELKPDLPEFLAPGASVTFTVSASVQQLGFPQSDALYMIGAHVRGATADGGISTLGRGRTFLPVASSAEAGKTALTSLVVLSSQPSYVGRTLFVDDHLAAEVADGGRLDVMLTHAARKGVSFAVDPALIVALEAMSAGYQVQTEQGPIAGVGAVAAERWLARFAALDSAAGYRLPFGNPDVAALARHGREAYLQRAVRAADQVARTAELPTVSLPALGLADDQTLTAAEQLDPSAHVLSDASTGTTAPAQSASGTPVISFAANAFAGGPGPEPLDSPVKVRQRMLASSWLDRDAGGRTVRLITTAQQAAQDETAKAFFIERATMAELISQVDESAPVVQPVYPDDELTDELTPAQLAQIDTLENNFSAYADLLVDPGDIETQIDAAVAAAASSAWRSNAVAQAVYLDPYLDRVAGILNGDAVTLGNDRKVVLTGSSGSFPLTVANNLDVPVQVKVLLTSSNSSRLKVKSIERITVQPGERMSVQVQAKPAANGEVEVSAQLTTVSGRTLGEPAMTTVQATEYGTIGWVIAIGAGVAFFGATALRIRQVRRERHAAVDEPAQDTLTSSAPPRDG